MGEQLLQGNIHDYYFAHTVPRVSEFDVMCVDIIWTLLLHLQLQMTQRHVRSLNFFIQLF